MAMTPAQRHFRRMQAAKQSGQASPHQRATGDQYELMMAALYEARRTLKGIKSIQAKIDKKRELLPQFEPYIEGVLASGAGAQDDVLMTCMVWLLDIGEFLNALDIAEYAIKHGLQTPDRYARDTASLVTEQVAEESLRLLADLEGSGPSEGVNALTHALARTDHLTTDTDMHDQIRAKLHKALGYAHREADNIEEALGQLHQALRLNERVGVKQDITKLEKELEKQQESES